MPQDDSLLPGGGDLENARRLIDDARQSSEIGGDRDEAKKNITDALKLLDQCIDGSYIDFSLKDVARQERQKAQDLLNSL